MESVALASTIDLPPRKDTSATHQIPKQRFLFKRNNHETNQIDSNDRIRPATCTAL